MRMGAACSGTEVAALFAGQRRAGARGLLSACAAVAVAAEPSMDVTKVPYALPAHLRCLWRKTSLQWMCRY